MIHEYIENTNENASHINQIYVKNLKVDFITNAFHMVITFAKLASKPLCTYLMDYYMCFTLNPAFSTTEVYSSINSLNTCAHTQLF
jgi:hypothetical protein